MRTAGEIKLKSIWVRHVTCYYTMRVPLKGYAFDEVYLPVFNGQVLVSRDNVSSLHFLNYDLFCQITAPASSSSIFQTYQSYHFSLTY